MKTCVCGKTYWPNQAWIHAKCMVANTAADVVANKRSGDRHKKSEARRKYMRDLMRKKRAALPRD